MASIVGSEFNTTNINILKIEKNYEHKKKWWSTQKEEETTADLGSNTWVSVLTLYM